MPKQSRSPERTSKRGKRQADALTGFSSTEGTRPTQVHDRLHIAYQPGHDVSHLTVRAKRMLGLAEEATSS